MSFDTAAGSWDTQARIERAGIIASEIASGLDAVVHRTALEFGCGTGLVGLNLRGRFDHMTLVDTSRAMIDRVRDKIRFSGIENVDALHLDIMNDSAAEGVVPVCDVIFSSMVFHHIPDTPVLLEKLRGLLTPGGQLCIVDLDREDGSFHAHETGFQGHNGFDQSRLGEMLAAAGFCNVSSKTFYRGMKDKTAIPYSLFIMRSSAASR